MMSAWSVRSGRVRSDRVARKAAPSVRRAYAERPGQPDRLDWLGLALGAGSARYAQPRHAKPGPHPGVATGRGPVGGAMGVAGLGARRGISLFGAQEHVRAHIPIYLIVSHGVIPVTAARPMFAFLNRRGSEIKEQRTRSRCRDGHAVPRAQYRRLLGDRSTIRCSLPRLWAPACAVWSTALRSGGGCCTAN